MLRLSGFELYSRWVPLKKFYSVKTSGVNIALNSKRYRSLSIWTFSQEVNQ